MNATASRNIVDAHDANVSTDQPRATSKIEYRNVGLGFAGNPNGPDVSTLVTVKLNGLQFHPVTCLVFGMHD